MTEEARSRREAMEQKDALLRRRFEFRSLVPEPHSAFAMCFFFHCYFSLGAFNFEGSCWWWSFFMVLQGGIQTRLLEEEEATETGWASVGIFFSCSGIVRISYCLFGPDTVWHSFALGCGCNRDELVDEEYLFGGQKLTAREEAEFRSVFLSLFTLDDLLRLHMGFPAAGRGTVCSISG